MPGLANPDEQLSIEGPAEPSPALDTAFSGSVWDWFEKSQNQTTAQLQEAVTNASMDQDAQTSDYDNVDFNFD